MTSPPNLFASLTCPICAHPLFVSTVMSDGTFIHERCGLQYFSETTYPKSLITNEKLQSTQLIPNNFINKLFKEYFETTDIYDEYFKTITLHEIEYTNLIDLILNTPKAYNLLSPTTQNDIKSIHIKRTNIKIANKFFSLMSDKQENKIFQIINSPQFDLSTFDFTITDNHNRTLFIKACEQNLTKFSLWLIETHKININHKSKHNDTPILWATYHNNSQICKALIQNGAEINHTDRINCTALLYACKNNMVDIALLILTTYPQIELDHISNNDNTILSYACKNNMHTVTQYILTNHSKTNIQLNIPSPDGDTPLMIACKNNNTIITSQLLDHPFINVNYINQHRQTALKIAYDNNNIKIMTLLLSHKNIKLIDVHVLPILLWACQNSHTDIILYILSNTTFNMKLLGCPYIDNNDETIYNYLQKCELLTVV